MSNLVLRGEGLHLWRGDRHVLRGVSLELRGGQVLQLTGSNGAGKTTLLRVLSGLSYAEEGNVFWRGENVRKNMHAYHAELAYIGHEPPLKADLTPRENLHYWVGVRRPLAAAEIDRALDEAGADEWRERTVRTLSAGQRRRVALAGLSLMGVPLWLLDEPTTNLDTAGQNLVTRLLEAHVARGGLAVVAVHHELGVGSVTLQRMVLAA
ncbi:MAG: cytochrome c biogenesis heme-transporting ATPase CcmA [Gammaproteobacteria bacterium]